MVKKILIAEDNEANYALLKAVLRKSDLTWVTNGQDAVNLARENKFDIILMDLKMPVVNGIEATKMIREFDKETVIVAITANAFEQDKTAFFNAGCSVYLPKPVRKKELERVVYGEKEL